MLNLFIRSLEIRAIYDLVAQDAVVDGDEVRVSLTFKRPARAKQRRTHDKTGRAYAKLSDVAPGSRLITDGDFTCIPEGTEVVVQRELNSSHLFFACNDGQHFLNGQVENGILIGLYPAAPPPAEAPPAAVLDWDKEHLDWQPPAPPSGTPPETAVETASPQDAPGLQLQPPEPRASRPLHRGPAFDPDALGL